MPVIVKQPKPNQYGSVYVQGTFMNRPIMKMFIQHGGFTEAKSPSEADFVVWAGGADINPSMYKQKPIPGTYFDTKLDTEDTKVYLEAKDAFKIGICRGAQLLNVLNGGSMWQDVDGHNDGGTHQIYDVITGELINVNTLHHQAMILPSSHGELVAYTTISKEKDNYLAHWSKVTDGVVDPAEVDVEVAWFENTKSLCFQGHPEFSHGDTRKYFFELIDRYCCPF